jgi:amino acid transporter
MTLKRGLSYFDLMNIVIGAIVGSDIYIVPGLTAGLIGPFSIVVWIVGGFVGMVLALVFAYCSYYVPNVGGPFAFVSQAFDDFWGFLTGWSMCIAELVALPVFAIVFTSYLQFFIPLSGPGQLLVKILFVSAITGVNLLGVKEAGRVNDVLTITKLAPLVLIILFALGSFVLNPNLLGNYTPFTPLGVGVDNFSTAFVLIFWAYAGFELGSLPASEVVDPKKNIPRAVISGMAIVTVFYVMVGSVVFGVVKWDVLAKSPIPLMLVSAALLGTVGAVITGFGALASVSGTDETEVLGTARLIYAISADGLFPKQFSRVHSRFQTPYVAIILEGVIALGLSLFSGVRDLISFAVFNLAICYLLVSLSLAVLRKKSEHGLHGQSILPWLGVGVSLYLLFATSLSDKIVGSILVLLGIPIYAFFARRRGAHDKKMHIISEGVVLARGLEKQNRFLANIIRLTGNRLRRTRRKAHTRAKK